MAGRSYDDESKCSLRIMRRQLFPILVFQPR